MKSTKKILALLLVFVMLFATLTACGGGDDSDTGDRTDLVYGLSADPSKLDPMAMAEMSSFTVTYAIYDNLYEEDADGNYVPSWQRILKSQTTDSYIQSVFVMM